MASSHNLKKSTRCEWLVNLALVATSLLIAFLFFEGVFRFLSLSWINVPSVHFDADTEYFNRSRFQSVFRFQNRVTKQNINTHGFRSPQISIEKEKGITRVAFIGDSFTYGFNVNDGEEYPAVVMRMLDGSGNYDYINAGVENIGLSHEVAIFRKYVKPFNPDVVVLSFCTNNDFQDIYMGPYQVKDRELNFSPPERLFAYVIQDFLYSNSITLFILRHSYILSSVREILSRRINRKRSEWLEARMPASDEEIVKDVFTFVRVLRDEARLLGAKFYLVIVPGKKFFEDQPMLRRLDQLLALAGDKGIQYLDLRPAFLEVLKQDPNVYEQLWQNPDQHWSAAGNQFAAGHVYKFLKGRL